MFKAVTGGDVIIGEYKYGDSFDFTPICRLIFSANHLPRSQDASYAFFRRWQVIPFEQTFEGGEAIPRRELDARLRAPGELSGLLNKALDALPRLRLKGFTEGNSMVRAWEEFQQTTDPLAVWLDKETVEGPDAWVTKDDLLNAYNKSCADDGRPYLTKKAIAQALKRLRPQVEAKQKTVNGKTTWCWSGVGLRVPGPGGGGGTGSDGSATGAGCSDGEGRYSHDSQDSQVFSNCYGEEARATNNNREEVVKPVNIVSARSGAPLGAPSGAPRGSDEQTDAPSNRRLTEEEVDLIKQLRAQGVPGWKTRDMVLGRELGREPSAYEGDAT